MIQTLIQNSQEYFYSFIIAFNHFSIFQYSTKFVEAPII